MPELLPVNSVTVVRGSSKTFELTVTDSTGKAADLTGARVVMTVKKNIGDRSALIQKDSNVGVGEVEITTPREGVVRIYLVPSDTSNLEPTEYVFDVWAVLSSGNRYPVIPPSTFVVEASVTVLS